MYFYKMGNGIHCSGTNLDSGLFRVVQYRSSMQAKDREKTGMTLLKVVYYEKKDTLIRVCFMCFFLTEILRFGCAEGATSSGRSPGRSVVPYGKFFINKNKKFGMLFTLQRAKLFTAFVLTRTLKCEQHTPNIFFLGCGQGPR